MALRMIRGSREGSAGSADRKADRPHRPRLRVVRGEPGGSPKPRAVAEILSDGTIKRLDAGRVPETESRSGWRRGNLSGDGWTLWWERRAWDPDAA